MVFLESIFPPSPIILGMSFCLQCEVYGMHVSCHNHFRNMNLCRSEITYGLWKFQCVEWFVNYIVTSFLRETVAFLYHNQYCICFLLFHCEKPSWVTWLLFLSLRDSQLPLEFLLLYISKNMYILLYLLGLLSENYFSSPKNT